ncbi:MAG: hypothetical protein CMJ18_28020 [Phycisphaeraceae bacterium]|nr:hypothetical protein [Phycisphaeraceae bacterium]
MSQVGLPAMPCPGRSARGAVLVVTLVGCMVLAALVFFVINHGRQVNARIVTQHSADAAGMAGAGWIARSFNTVSMNNVSMTRMIALIHALDAMPLATRGAHVEQAALRDALAARIGSLATPDAWLTDVARDQFDRMLSELNDEVAILQPTDAFWTDQFDVSAMTAFEGPSGPGSIWEALRGLDAYSRVAMETLGTLAQVHAVNGGEVNLVADRAAEGSAVMLPVRPEIPWRRGEFNDFERPVAFGLLPGADRRLRSSPTSRGLGQVDDERTNRGPYDTIYGWRHFLSVSSGGAVVFSPYDSIFNWSDFSAILGGGGGGGGGSSSATLTVGGVDTSGRPNVFGGGPSNRSEGGPTADKRAYTVSGTHAWAMRQVSGFAAGHLRFSRYSSWARQLADTKMRYVWGGDSARRFAIPDWDVAYPSDLDTDAHEPLPFSGTAWFRLDIKSRYPRDDAQFGSAGSWAFEDRPLTSYEVHARIERPNRWWLPEYQAALPGGGVERRRMIDPDELNDHHDNLTVTDVGEQAWLYEYEYQVLFDPEIGLPALLDDDGNMVPQPAYFVQVVIYAAVNRNAVRPGVFDPRNVEVTGDGEIDEALVPVVANPYEGFDPSAAEAPAPIDFDHEQIDSGEEVRRERFTFLGAAQRSDRPLLWPSRFQGGKPYPMNVALAEGHVFNNHSWDLWTQMWHAQLKPVEDFGHWLDVIDRSLLDAEASEVVSEIELEDLGRFLGSVEALGEIMMAH